MAIRLVDVSKTFTGTRALRDVSIDFQPGEIHGLVGENGAGKTTLVNILSGVLQPSGGHIEKDGAALAFTGSRDALAAGVAHVSQEGNLVPTFSGAENILLGSEPGRIGTVDRRGVRRQAEALRAQYFPEHRIDLSRPVQELDYADQKIVEILRALHLAASVLILDEPTAALARADAAQLATVIRRLRDGGMTVIVISHFLGEVLALSDRISILRDGQLVQTVATEAVTEADVIAAMLAGRAGRFERRERLDPPAGRPPRLAVSGWRSPGHEPVDLTVNAGEVVGLIGLAEAGHTVFAESLFDARRSTGEMRLDGEVVHVRRTADALRHGIALVPDQRMAKSLAADASIRASLSLVNLPRVAVGRLPVVSVRSELRAADGVFRRLRIKAHSLEQEINQLSGGNKQKVSIGKWLFGVDPEAAYRVAVFIEPTEGVDIGVKSEIHDIIAGLARAGLAVVLVSSDLLEIEALADRVIAFRHGRAVEEIGEEAFSEARFVDAMAQA